MGQPIDDFTRADGRSALATEWRVVTDQVMGGVSVATLERTVLHGESCLRLIGDVRLDNDGGFAQAALDLGPFSGTFDASDYAGLRLRACGNGETYAVHLRTSVLREPWQSYRATFSAGDAWRDYVLPFNGFEPHRTETPFDPSVLKRLGIVAIGRRMQADVAIAFIGFD